MEIADYEYTVAQKSEGKWRVRKWLMFSAYAVFAIGYFSATALTIPAVIAVLPLLLWMLVFFTYRYVKPEYKYKISEAYLYFYVVYGKKQREKLKLRIFDADFIIPLETAIEEIKAYNVKRTYSAIPALASTDSYIILFKNEKGEACAFMFKATAQALKCLHFYNKKTVITPTDV